MVSKEIEKKIDEWCDAHKEEYLADLAKLVAVDSAAEMGVLPGEYPFGEGSAKALETARKMAEEIGFKAENRDNYCVVADMGDGDEKVGIFGHLDVVPCGSEWKYPPFEMTRDGDMLVGRGVTDDKGPLWASVYSVRCLKELGLLPRRQIEIFMGGDEECGMCDIEHYIETTEKMPVISFTPDASWPICHGEKGIMRFEFLIPNEDSNIVSWDGGTVRNVVSDHSELLLDVPYDVAGPRFEGLERVTAVADGDMTRVIGTGAAVHASMPKDGISAIDLVAKAVIASGLANDGAMKALQFVAMVDGDYNGASIGCPFEDEPSGKLTHVAGVIHLADGKFALSIDIRYPVTESGDRVIGAIREYTKNCGVEIVDLEDSAPIYISADSDFVKTTMETINQVFKRDWKPYTMGGGTYARHLNNAYAIGPEDDERESPFGPYRGGIHQPDETGSIENLMNAMKVYARLLVNLDGLEF